MWGLASEPKEIAMRQLIIATATLILLTAVSSVLAVRTELQSVTHCDPFVACSPC